MCLGDIIERIIHYSTIGFGKSIAQRVANFFGFEDCGCSERQEKLNAIFGCKKVLDNSPFSLLTVTVLFSTEAVTPSGSVIFSFISGIFAMISPNP